MSSRIFAFILLFSLVWNLVEMCSPELGRIQDPALTQSKCSDLILYPVNAVDQNDQYRFDYSDVSFGNTHSQGATVTITCTSSGSSTATVEAFDQHRDTIATASSVVASCTNVGGQQFTWTIGGRILQFVDCR